MDARARLVSRRIATMAAMQESHNLLVHPRWREQGHAYYRAIWVECAELLDHYGWKWWKSHEADLDQVRLEIVDIWHFGLSELMRADAVDDALAAALADGCGAPEGMEFPAAVERMAEASLASGGFDLGAFIDLMNALPMSFDELFEIYVGKNVLNAFRQRHGYRDGDYVKVWHGREDNEHLAELLRGMDSASPTFVADLEQALADRYPGRLGRPDA